VLSWLGVSGSVVSMRNRRLLLEAAGLSVRVCVDGYGRTNANVQPASTSQ
jgi:hypothetical protein